MRASLPPSPCPQSAPSLSLSSSIPDPIHLMAATPRPPSPTSPWDSHSGGESSRSSAFLTRLLTSFRGDRAPLRSSGSVGNSHQNRVAPTIRHGSLLPRRTDSFPASIHVGRRSGSRASDLAHPSPKSAQFRARDADDVTFPPPPKNNNGTDGDATGMHPLRNAV